MSNPAEEDSERAEARLAGFLADYDPAIADLARGIRRGLRQLVPGGFELVYDNYNGLVIGYGPTDKGSDAVISIALYPRWVRLFLCAVSRRGRE